MPLAIVMACPSAMPTSYRRSGCALEMCIRDSSDLAQELNVVERLEPLGIVEHERLAVREVNEALHLPLETLGIVLDLSLIHI